MAALNRTTKASLRIEKVVVASCQPRAHSTTSMRQQHQQVFRSELIERYKCQDRKRPQLLKCMVLNRYLPRKNVSAGHILHLEQPECFAPIGLNYATDKFNSRNGVLWHEDIERCYGNQEVVSSQSISCHRPTIRSRMLIRAAYVSVDPVVQLSHPCYHPASTV